MSCLDPRKFFQHTGGALPQAVNFGLKIQNVVAQTTGISFVKGENRTVAQNHKSTCFIRTRQKISLDKPSVYRKDRVKVSTAKDSKSANSDDSTFDYSRVSQRYRQLAQYLENIANGRFTTLDGDALDASIEDGIAVLEADIEKANKFLIIEGLSLVLYKMTELTKSTIEGQTLELYSRAKDSLWELKKKNGLVNHKWEEQTFWGLKLGSKIEVKTKYFKSYDGKKWLDGHELSIDGKSDGLEYEVYYKWVNPRNPAERECCLAGHEEWPILIFPCSRKQLFRKSYEFCLITSFEGILVGIHWHGKIEFGAERKKVNPKEIVQLFESKYNIHFKRKLVNGIFNGKPGLVDGKYGFYTLQKGMGRSGIDETPFAYEDKDVRIYIGSSYPEEVVVLLNNFEEIIKQSKLRVETEKLSKPADISVSDSL